MASFQQGLTARASLANCRHTKSINFFKKRYQHNKDDFYMQQPQLVTHEKPTVSTAGVVYTNLAHRMMTPQELDAARNCVSESMHTKITMLPNHSINPDGELEGFVFECCGEDSASVLPLTKSSFATTAVYECLPDTAAFRNLSSDIERAAALLMETVRSIDADNEEPLKFDCMPDWENAAVSQLKDQRAWRESIPAKIGVYHAFMRTTAQNMREHKLFIVVSGHCRHASEELYNLWLDARETITVKQFMDCAEVDWLRKATLRHHNRLAARLARNLGLNVRYIDDVDAVTSTSALLPTTCSVSRDLVMRRGRVALTSDAVLLDGSKSGVVFDCFASEGFWVFMGPRDTGSYRMFGTELRVSDANAALPSKTVRHHRQFPAREKANIVSAPARRVQDAPCDDISASANILYHKAETCYTSFLFPHADFVQAITKLGYNMNDGITNLMPIVVYCEDE